MDLFETKLIDQKSLIFSLTSVFGIGKRTSKFVCKNLGFSQNFKVINLEKEQSNELIRFIKNLKLIVGGDLKKSILINKNRQVSIKSYKGLRKKQGLPVRGQRTHTNAKTSRRNYF